MKTKLWLSICLILMAVPAWATDYWVAPYPAGDDMNDGLSAMTPKEHINAALDLMGSCDTLTIVTGVYVESIGSSNLPSGSPGSPPCYTIIQAYGDGLYGGDGEVWLEPTSVDHVINIGDRHWIKFDKIRVSGAGTGPTSNSSSVALKIHSGSTHIIFTNGELDNAANVLQIADLGTGFNEISYSEIHRSSGDDPSAFGGLPGHCVYVGESDNWIHHNEVYDCTGFGIHIYNNGEEHRANNNLVEANRVHHVNYSDEDHTSAGLLAASGDDNVFINNVVWNVGGDGYGSCLASGFGAEGTIFYHNTCFSVDGYAVSLDNTFDVVIKNNLFIFAVTNYVFEHNAPSSTWTATDNFFDDEFGTDFDGFVDIGSGNFRLTCSAVALAINTGTDVDVEIDADDNTRPIGGYYDIGAYEYQSECFEFLVSHSSVYPSDVVTVSWDGIPAPDKDDWIAFYDSSASDANLIDWMYVSCPQTPKDALASGSCPFTIPSTLGEGTYEFRLFSDDSWNRLAVSRSIQVVKP